MIHDNDCRPLIVKNSAGDLIEVVNYPYLLSMDADVYIIFGMRSFGKSYGIYQYALNRWLDNREQFAVLRTIDDDIRPGNLRKLMSGIDSWFSDATNREKRLDVYQGAIIARSVDGEKTIRETIGHGLSLSGWMKYKGNNYDQVTTIIFEEFIEKRLKITNSDMLDGYLNDLSTIIRHRSNVKVFCLANTIRKKSPIFDYYKIKITKIKKGQPVLFQEENGLKVVVYWTPDPKKESAAAKHYTVSDSSTARMITTGAWETGEYPKKANGIPAQQILNTRAHRNGIRIYFADIGICCSIPYRKEDGQKIVFYPPDPGRKIHLATDMITLYVRYPDIYREIIKSITCKDVLMIGSIAEQIDMFLQTKLFDK